MKLEIAGVFFRWKSSPLIAAITSALSSSSKDLNLAETISANASNWSFDLFLFGVLGDADLEELASSLTALDIWWNPKTE